jgi:hypothetical protein
VSQLRPCVGEVLVSWVHEVQSLHSIRLSLGSEHGVADDGLGYLEEDHLPTDVFGDVVGSLEGSDEAVVNDLCLLEVGGKVL